MLKVFLALLGISNNQRQKTHHFQKEGLTQSIIHQNQKRVQLLSEDIGAEKAYGKENFQDEDGEET